MDYSDFRFLFADDFDSLSNIDRFAKIIAYLDNIDDFDVLVDTIRFIVNAPPASLCMSDVDHQLLVEFINDFTKQILDEVKFSFTMVTDIIQSYRDSLQS